MTQAVFDASALVPLLVTMVTTGEATAMTKKYDICSLDFARIEVANTLVKHCRVGNVDMEQALRANEHLLHMCDWQPACEWIPDAVATAVEHRHSVYDCLYVALARSLNVPLITGDKRLSTKFEGLVPAGIVNLYEGVRGT